MPSETTSTNKYKIKIGKNEKDASYFDEKNKCIIIPVIVKDLIHRDSSTINSFERIIFISGCKYDIHKVEHNVMYIIKCFSYKELMKIIPAVKLIYKQRNYDVEIEIGEECQAFFQ